MANKENSISKPFFTFFMILLLLAAQSAFALGDNETTIDYKEKIMNTGNALGISVYEDYPVYLEAPSENDLDSNLVLENSKQIKLPTPVPQPVEVFEGKENELAEKSGLGSFFGYVGTVFSSVYAQAADNGYVPWENAVPTFEEISNNILTAVKKTKYSSRTLGQESLFKESGFIREFEDITGAKFYDGNSVDFLIDGPESFAMKEKLIREAKESLYVTTWAFYDDTTGKVISDMLIAKKKEGVDVKVILDGKVVAMHGSASVKNMEKNGIEIIRYKDAERGADIWHVKMIISDEKYSIVGGMNFGDPYSHKNPSGEKWRDTDVLYSGPAVQDSIKIFADTWNKEVESKDLSYGKIEMSSDVSYAGGKAKISVVLQNPPTDSKILTSIIKGIYGASDVINIENAYFIAIPAILEAIKDARERGVEVNILTNSYTSIDPECKDIVPAIYHSLEKLKAMGVNVYLKKGETLHSKFMTVDGIFANIGSYNLHPRGERYDTELNVNIINADNVRELDEAFKEDLAVALKVDNIKDLVAEDSWLSSIAEEYFFAHLGR
jgi:cardiolipin synthase A/B